MKTYISRCFTLIIASAITNAYAEVRLSGYFIARAECPAYQSMRRQTNPGNVSTEIDQAYDLISKNKESATHYLIKMDAVPNRRWVALNCGEHVVPVGSDSTATDDSSTPSEPPTGSAERYILAVSWQPSFCETRPSKQECKTQTEQRFDASNFTLHGLWPQPRNNIYCDVAPEVVATDKDRKWHDLPALPLEDATRAELNRVMPGSQSNLHRHEWIKHGTCYSGESPDEYYKDSIKLMRELNRSAVRTLFADNIGKEVTATRIRKAFDHSFGDGAGDKIKIACKKDGRRQLISEITLSIRGNLDELSMGNALLGADDASSTGCNRGIVDRVGLQ